MTSTLNPYVVDRAVHTEGLFGMMKTKIVPKNIPPASTPGAPKAPTPKAAARGVFNMFKKQTPSELFAKYAADTKNYSHVARQAKANHLGVFNCYYLITPDKLLKCTSALKPGWQGTPEAFKSGTMNCRTSDTQDEVEVPYPSEKVVWIIT